MKQLTLTTQTGTVTYDLASLAPLPAIKAGCLTFRTRAGMEVSVPAADVLEFSIGTAPKMTKSDRLKADLAAIDDELYRRANEVHEAANECALPSDSLFADSLRAYVDACAQAVEKRAKAEKFFERRAETERKRAAGETKPRAKKAAPVVPVDTTPTPKAKRAKK